MPISQEKRSHHDDQYSSDPFHFYASAETSFAVTRPRVMIVSILTNNNFTKAKSSQHKKTPAKAGVFSFMMWQELRTGCHASCCIGTEPCGCFWICCFQRRVESDRAVECTVVKEVNGVKEETLDIIAVVGIAAWIFRR